MFRFFKKRKEEVFDNLADQRKYQKMIVDIVKKMYHSDIKGLSHTVLLMAGVMRCLNDSMYKIDVDERVYFPYIGADGNLRDTADYRIKELTDDLKRDIEKVYEKDDVEISRRFISTLLKIPFDRLDEGIKSLIKREEERDIKEREVESQLKKDQDKLNELLAN